FASYGVDYLKYDWCSGEQWYATQTAVYGNDIPHASYQWMAQALRATGRPMVFKSSVYGHHDTANWCLAAGVNVCGVTGDMDGTWTTMIGAFDSALPYASTTKIGRWNDL